MFKTQAKKATERAKRSNENYKRWVEDNGRVARSSLGTVRTEKVKVCLHSSGIDCRRMSTGVLTQPL